jgi:hypothetical protein
MATEGEVKRIVDEHADALTQLPNVVGVGIQQADDDAKAAVVADYVRAKVPEAGLKPSEIVPRTLTATIAGVKVDAPTQVIEVGDITH